jgi:hypothetical protein
MRKSKKPVLFLMSDEAKEYFRQTGKLGGLKRATLYSNAQPAKWGKRGGRPPKPLKPDSLRNSPGSGDFYPVTL